MANRSPDAPAEPLTQAVLATLTGADPESLIAAGAPADEYEAEAGDIAAHLREHGTITADRLTTIWAGWFGTTAALLHPGNRTHLDRLAADLDALPR